VLNLFIRAIVLYIFLLIAMRLMGKRQLGELQPFEFAITLVAAELACIPMADQTIPIIYGIIPVFTLFLVHILITKIGVKSMRFRKVLNGAPMIVIDKGNILNNHMKKLDMDANDLLASLRTSGYFTPAEVECAIVETNGMLTVLPKYANKPVSNADLNITGGTSQLPVTLIVNGKWLTVNEEALDNSVTRERVLKMLQNLNLEQKDIFLLTLAGETAFIQPFEGAAIFRTVAEILDGNAAEVNQKESAEENHPELN
jgi:uncharacterized membrane protein YcaP (DUF421 family)